MTSSLLTPPPWSFCRSPVPRRRGGRDIDAVAVNILSFDDDVSKIDADAEFDAAAFGRGAVALDHAELDGDRTAHGLDRASEIYQQAIAGALDDAAMVCSDPRLDDLAEMRHEPTERTFLIVAHQPTIPGDIKRQDRRKLAFSMPIFHRVEPSVASQVG